MKIKLKIEGFNSYYIGFKPELEVLNLPQICIFNYRSEHKVNVDFLTGTFQSHHFSDTILQPGLNEFPLIWTSYHLVELFPKCNGIFIFNCLLKTLEVASIAKLFGVELKLLESKIDEMNKYLQIAENH